MIEYEAEENDFPSTDLESVDGSIDAPTPDEVQALADKLDDLESEADQEIKDDLNVCPGCGYEGLEDECPECGELMGKDIVSVDQEKAAVGLPTESKLTHLVVKESENKNMSKSDKFFGKPIRADKSEHLADQPAADKEHGGVDANLRKRPKNNADVTPIMKGTSKGMGESKLKNRNLRTMQENVVKLAEQIRRAIKEHASGLRGPHKVNFTTLVTETKCKNRTPRRRKLAEAVADIEEILQFHPIEDVVLEAWFINRSGHITKKQDINLVNINPRGPIVAEGKALFRFKRNAEYFANSLAESGVPCRIGKHNWGTSVAAKVSMETANRAFATINEAGSWKEWLGGLFGGKRNAQAAPAPAAPAAAPTPAAPQPAAPQPAAPEDPQAALRREMDAENARRGYVPKTAPSSYNQMPKAKQLFPAGAGKLRKDLAYEFKRADDTLAQVRKAIASLQESLIKHGVLAEEESVFGGDDDAEKWATQMAASSPLGGGQLSPQKAQTAKAAGMLGQVKALAGIIMPDEQGTTPEHYQKMAAVVNAYRDKIIKANQALAAYAKRFGVSGIMEARLARKLLSELRIPQQSGYQGYENKSAQPKRSASINPAVLKVHIDKLMNNLKLVNDFITDKKSKSGFAADKARLDKIDIAKRRAALANKAAAGDYRAASVQKSLATPGKAGAEEAEETMGLTFARQPGTKAASGRLGRAK